MDQSTEASAVSFCCQKCGSPLRLDSSLHMLPDKRFLQELTAPMFNREDVSRANTADMDPKTPEYTANFIHKTIQSSTYSQPDSEFTLVGTVDQSSSSNSSLSHTFQVQSALFDILSSQAEVDHPLCEECTDILLDLLDKQLKDTEEECKSYKDFLEQLENTQEEDNSEDYDLALQQLQDEEAELRSKIAELDSECRRLDQELTAESGKQHDLRNEEQEFLKEYNELKRQVIELDEEDRSVENQLKYSEAQLNRLTKVNAFNSTFHIWHNGHFGTINGFRLGRLPNVQVEWNEINTAWGQTVLLLHSLARKMGLVFQRYRLVPYGSHSYIESLADKTKELPLHGSGGIRFFWDSKFDQAMVAFLDCLQQFKEQVEKDDNQFCLPYRMANGKIEDNNTSYSIKVQFNSEEQWTKALKFMLTNLRWGLAWVSSQYANSE